MDKLLKLLDRNIFWVSLLISIPAILALIPNGFYGASDDIHIAWLYELHETLKTGQFPPRFVPDLSFGFGYPLFNFVFPLPFYIAEVFHLIGFSLVDSIKIIFFLSVPISFVAMYKLLKEFLPISLGFGGAILYVYTPYRATDLYVRGAIGEIAAFAILPWVLLSLIKLMQIGKFKQMKWKWIGTGGISVALLILTHNIISYMFLPASIFLVFLAMFFLKKSRTLICVNTTMMFFFGLLASGYFWLPAILESSLMKYDTVFNFWDHFPSIKQLFTPYFGYGASVPGPGDGISFFIGGVNILVIVLGIMVGFINWKKLIGLKKVIVSWSLIILLLSIFMMNHRSTFLWQFIPNLPYFQFPWRFLTMVTFVTPLFLVPIAKFKYRKVIFIAVSVFSIILNFSYFKPQDFLGRNDQYFIDRYIPIPTPSEEYIKTGEEYLRLPKEAEKRPDKVYPTFFSGGSTLNLTDINQVNKLGAVVRFDVEREVVVNYNKYFFPGWVGEIDGEKLKLFSGKPFGQISFYVSPGKHSVEISYREPGYKIFLNLVSLVTFLLLFSFSLDSIRLKLLKLTRR